MKKIANLLAASALLCSCSTNYTVTGRYELPPGDSVVLLGTGNRILASGVVGADTTITLKGKVPKPETALLTNKDRTARTAFLFLEPGVIRIEGLGERGYIVSGTPLNDQKRAFEAEMAVLSGELRKAAPGQSSEAVTTRMDTLCTRAVDHNRDNLFGAWVFSQYEFPSLRNDAGKIKARLAQFTPEMQADPMLKRSRILAEAIERTAVGQHFTDLTLKNATGETVALSSLAGRGRWVLLDFWATWCKPCMLEVPYLKKAFDALKDNGFAIYGVSLDSDLARWKEVIGAEGMTWTNTAVRNDDKIDATALYNINSIPTNFLIAPDGTIVAKNLPGRQLQARLEELMK